MHLAQQREDERFETDPVPPHVPERRSEIQAAWIVAGLTLLALVLRFWHLGDWNFQATEIFTLRDSDGPQFANPRPLGYVLNYYLIRPFLPMDEFSLRLLPAIFGVLAIPVLFLVTRPLVGVGAAVFSCLLLAVSPLHVMYSQLARYWSLVFLLSVVYPCALYVGIRDRKPRWILLGIVTAILASLAHPVSILLLGGPAIWLLSRYLRPSHLRRMWAHPSFRKGVFAAAVVALVVANRFVTILQSWISEHDRNPRGGGQFLNWIPGTTGVKQVAIVLGYLESLTVPVAVAGMAGIYLLWRERSRSLGLLLTVMGVFPIAFLTLLSLRTPVSQYYLLPTTPVFLIGAGVFLDRVTRLQWRLRPGWLVPGTLAAIFVASAAPTLFSDLRDGRRYDFRGAARWLAPQLTTGDVVFSDQYMVLRHYLPQSKVQRLRNSHGLREAVQELQQQGHGVLWIVAPAPSHPFRTNLKRGGLIDWIYGNCQLRHSRGIGRVDLRQHYLQVYRCPPQLPAQIS